MIYLYMNILYFCFYMPLLRAASLIRIYSFMNANNAFIYKTIIYVHEYICIYTYVGGFKIFKGKKEQVGGT